MILVATVPLGALVVRNVQTQYRLELEEGARDARRLAETTAGATTQLLMNSERLLRGSAATLQEELLDPDRCEPALKLIASMAPYLTTAGVMDATGSVVCSALPMPGPSYRQAGDLSWHRAALRGGHFGVGSPVYGGISKAWVTALGVPIHDESGAVAAVLSSSLRLGSIQDVILGLRIADDELVTIMDAERRILARSHGAEEMVGTIPDEAPNRPEAEEFSPGRSFVYGGADAEGVERAWASVDLPEVGWVVWAGIPAARARAPALAAIAPDVFVSFLVLTLTLLLAWRIQRSMSGAVTDLVTAAASGGRDAAWPIAHGPVEFRALAGTLRDAFEAREEADRATLAVSRRYRSILDNAVFGIVVSNRNGEIIEANPAFAAMMGHGSPDEVRQVRAQDLYADVADRERLIDKIETMGLLRDEEARWIRKDGREIIVRINGRVVETNADGYCYEMLMEDITAQKDMENALRQSQKMEGVGQLAGGVAHDFNNLLTVISGNAELALARVENEEEPLHAELSEIASATERAQAVTRQLLELSRSRPAEEKALDLSEIVRGLRVILTRLLGEHIDVEVDLARELPLVWGDESQVEQVLLNLVVNARDAMPDGGTLSVRTALVEPDHALPGLEPECWVVLTVRDTGRGIEPDALDRIFEPFYTTKPSGAGTGLGLATSLATVTAMDGRLLVDSRPGHGAEFQVWFPPMSDEPGGAAHDPVERESANLPGPGGSETVLVAEDDIGVSRFVCSVLELAGYGVTSVADGQQAIDLLQNGATFDLVLTDVVMPGRSGTDVVQETWRLLPEARVLLMSGYTGELPVSDVVSRDPDLLLSKPFTMRQLLERVRLILDRDSGTG